MNKVVKYVAPLGVLVVGALAYTVIVNNPPKTIDKKGQDKAAINVQASVVSEKPFNIEIKSYGVVEPKTLSNVVSQVSGEVTYVSDSFREGGYFKKGEILLHIDDRDYLANLEKAKEALATAELQLYEEKARSLQAKEDWIKLRKDEKPDELALRLPYLKQAESRVSSAKATVRTALLDLERTKIKAPFDGRVLAMAVGIGQVVPNNFQFGEIYSTDSVEIRLPINNSDINYLSLPDSDVAAANVRVDLWHDSNPSQVWEGRIIRAGSAINSFTQQQYVIAEIKQPFNSLLHKKAIKIGQFLNAQIEGETINDAIVVNNNSVYQSSFVYTVNNDEVLRTPISIQWQNEEVSIVAAGLKQGELLVETPLGRVSSGTKVVYNLVNLETLSLAENNE